MTGSTHVALRGLVKRYDGTSENVVDGVDLDLERGTLTTLLGPSGCGKTTALKLLAGLLEPTDGQILFDGASMLGVPPERRPVAMVFQKPLLFPHLSVGENVAFGLRMRRIPTAERRRRVAEMLDLVRLPGYEDRRAGELSGGQEQRVSLARALVVEPQVLLLDEPLSQLDAGLRVEMRELVRRVQREVGVTTLFVTHDQEEAVAVSDRVALMLDGKVEQEGAPEVFYERPASLRVARFFGTANLVPGSVRAGWWHGPLGPVAAPEVADGPGTLVVRQEALSVSTSPDAPGLPATVVDSRYLGTAWDLQLVAGETLLRAVTPPTAKAAPGDEVRVSLPEAHGHVLGGHP
ncbi:MAG: ABC transporter ATP-binding protein [Motilibacteraceae bacterium]